MSAVLELLEASTVPSSRSEAVASLRGVTKRYSNGVMALGAGSAGAGSAGAGDAAGFSLELRRGEIVALLGPNGAGKSTAVRLMMGLSTPTSGEVRIFGADPRHTEARLRTGVMLQVGRAPEMLRVREHLTIFRGYYPKPMAYDALIKAAGLEGLEERFFGQLSGGQKQRVLFALALAGDPDLIFLDEPTVGLDIEARRLMWAEIRSLAARGKTVLLTTHYLEEADALAGRIIVINKGRVICEGTPAEVKSMGSSLATSTSGHGTRTVKIIRCITSMETGMILAIPGVTSAETSGTITIITSTQPEATLREMLALDQTLSSLEVASPALEDAFLSLTSRDRA